MYKVYRNGRTATKTWFYNYEQARQFIRKKLRKATPNRSTSGQPVDYLNGSMALSGFGYSIKQVD